MTRHELILVIEQALDDAGLSHADLNSALKSIVGAVDAHVKEREKQIEARAVMGYESKRDREEGRS